MAYARRTDTTQTEVVEALRALGFSVAITSRLGDGFVDAVIAKNKRTWLVEIKNGLRGWSLTKKQRDFHEAWKGEILIFDGAESVITWNERLRETA